MPTPSRYLRKVDIPPKTSTRPAGEVQCLGEMPWVSRATALWPDAHQVRQTQPWVKSLSIRAGTARVSRR
jgi:hypothetical protein